MCQPLRQQFPASGEPTCERSLWPAELLSRILDRLTLQITEQDGKPVDFGQTVQFPVEEGLEVVPEGLRSCRGFGQLLDLSLAHPPLRSQRSCFQGRAEGDSVQPVGDSVRRLDGRSLAGEDEKGCLPGILGVVVIPENATANTHVVSAKLTLMM